MGGLIRFSITHPISVLMAVLTPVLLGILALFFIPLDYLPRVNVRSLLVSAAYEGIPASEMRRMIAMPLEEALSPLRGLKNISSVSRDGLCLIRLELHWNTAAESAIAECRELIDAQFEKLPSGCKKPVVVRDDASRQAAVSLALVPQDGELRYARYTADTAVKPRLQRLENVGAVRVTGGEKEEIAIRVHKEKMEAKKITLQFTAEKIAAANYEYPAGTIRDGDLELLFKTSGLYRSIDEIAQTPLLYGDGGMITVGDIASVERSAQERESFFLYDGIPCILIEVFKKRDASPVTTSRHVSRELATLQELFGNRYRFVIITDSSQVVIRAALMLVVSALAGSVATFAVIFFVFRSRLIAVLLAAVIPLTVPISVLALALCGKTLNSVSLSGITVGIGMVVDSGAVVLENLQKKLRSGLRSPADIENGVREVALSNTGSALTTAAVFLPVLFLKGTVPALFSDLAIAVISAVVASCVWSLTCIPALVVLLLPHITGCANDNLLIIKAAKTYEHLLTRIMHKKRIAVYVLSGCLFAGCAAFFCLKTELLPVERTNLLQARIEFQNGVSLEAIESYAQKLFAILSIDASLRDIHISGGIEKDDYASLAEPDKKKETLFLQCRVLKPHALFAIKEKISALTENGTVSLFFDEDGGMLSDALNMQNGFLVFADSPEDSLLAARSLGVADEYIQPFAFTAEQVFTPDRTANSRFGVSAFAAASIAHFSLVGTETAPFYEHGIQIPVRVSLRTEDIQNIGMFGNLGVPLQNGSIIPLRFLGTIEQVVNEKTLYRYNRRDARLVSTVSSKKLMHDFVKNDFFALTDLQKDALEEIASDTVFLLAGVIALLYVIMAAQFESFLIPLLLLLALPPAFSGAFVFLLLFGKTLNMNSVIALVILFGTAINNSILLYESCIDAKNLCEQTIVSRCTGKLRAVLVTSATTIAALLPFAAGLADRAQASLAIAVIGGLAVSTLIVLYVVPVIFSRTLIKRRRHE